MHYLLFLSSFSMIRWTDKHSKMNFTDLTNRGMRLSLLLKDVVSCKQKELLSFKKKTHVISAAFFL